jgi:hypothetical protein
MASSNSLFAGSAALQGLGAAAQAYSNLEKREAEIAKTVADTGIGTISTDPGTGLVMETVMVNGRPVRISRAEFLRLQRAGKIGIDRQFVGDPRELPATTPASAGPNSGGLVPATAPAAPPPGTPPGVAGAAGSETPPAGQEPPPEGQAPASADPLSPAASPGLRQLVEDNIARVEEGGIVGSTREDMPFEQWEAEAQVFRSSARDRLALGASLSRLAAEGNTGRFQEQIMLPLQEWVRSSVSSLPANTAGRDEALQLLTNPNALRDAQVVDKVVTLFAQSAARDGSRAFAALQQAMAAIPRASNSPMAAAQLYADIILGAGEAQDRERMGLEMRRYAAGRGLSNAQLNVIGRGASPYFERAMRGQYAKEKQIIEGMFLARVRDGGQPTGESLLSYVIKNGGRIPDESIRKKFVETFGPGSERVLRHFSSAFGG